MTDVLEAKARSGTHTIQRLWDDTETPEQAVDTKEADQVPFLAWNLRDSHVGVLTFVSGAKGYGTTPCGVEALFVSSPQDQADAIFEPPGADLSDRLQDVLCTLPLVAPGEEFVPPEVMKRLLSRITLITPQRVPNSTSAQTRRRYDCFRSKLIAALLDEPIEDGVTHPAEHVIDEALRTNSSECRDWLSETMVEHYQTRPSIGASIVRCIGRLEYDQVGLWGMRVIDDALQNRDAEVRDAAICALEAWGGPAALNMLRRHQDAEPWLNEYVKQVIVDLSGTSS